MRLRIGTPALASRGFVGQDFAEIADLIAEALKPSFDDGMAAELHARVAALTSSRPLYPHL
jgi:glycine hydroxymethyltransferase